MLLKGVIRETMVIQDYWVEHQTMLNHKRVTDQKMWMQYINQTMLRGTIIQDLVNILDLHSTAIIHARLTEIDLSFHNK